MTNEIKNMPELRFSGFSEEWKKKKLEEIAYINDGTHMTPNYVQAGIPFFSVENVTRNDFVNSKFVTEEAYEKYKKRIDIEYNDILMTRIGSIGKVKLVNWIHSTTFYVSLALLKIHEGFVPQYISYLLESFKVQKSIMSNSLVTAVPQKINLIDLKKVDIVLTISINEQQRIGDFFSKLDRQIELEEQKLSLLEEQKKGYMQKIFSQELRFKDENGNDYPEWEDKLISDIGKVITGNTPSKKENDYWNSNQYIWVTPTDISNKKNIYTSGYQLSQKGFSKARQLPKNTLLITCIASIGKNAILRIEGSCNQQINAVIPNDNYDVDYLYYAFEDVSKLMKSIAGKTATQIVNKAVFEKLLLNVPIYEEQQKISGFLNKVDILIDKQAQKINELKLRKQGFLQKMFV
ncbi:MAG: restriction endonuclease subunit S [Staphylococcus equorum]